MKSLERQTLFLTSFGRKNIQYLMMTPISQQCMTTFWYTEKRKRFLGGCYLERRSRFHDTKTQTMILEAFGRQESMLAVAARLIILSDPILSALPDPQSLTLSYGDGSH